MASDSYTILMKIKKEIAQNCILCIMICGKCIPIAGIIIKYKIPAEILKTW